jgi:glutamine synthetase
MVYTVGPQADPGGIVREITDALSRLGLEVLAVNHEFMNSQYEVNLRHTDALRAADRAFRLKAAVKDIGAQRGLVATFMGKPFNDQGGSRTHLHVSLNRDEHISDWEIAEYLTISDVAAESHAGAASLVLSPADVQHRKAR